MLGARPMAQDVVRWPRYGELQAPCAGFSLRYLDKMRERCNDAVAGVIGELASQLRPRVRAAPWRGGRTSAAAVQRRRERRWF